MTDTSPVRAARWPELVARPLGSPIQPSVVYAAESPDALDQIYEDGDGFTYAREGHPNAAVLASLIDGLEAAAGGIVTGSGMSAVSAVLLGILKAGDHVVGADRLYGRSLRLMTQDLPRLGIATTLVDATDAAAIKAAMRPETRLVLVEVISNPGIRIADMDAIYAAAGSVGALVAVDNTFTTPRLYRPLEAGADIVIHSVTKLLAGHSDATLGYVAARDPDLMQAIDDANQTWGLTASPFDCWLAERGLQTFDLRLDRAEANAAALADHLSRAPKVVRVLYPGQPDHPDRARAQRLLGNRSGNMLSFEIAGGRAKTNAFVRGAGEVAFAPTLGDVGTTLSHPASSSHRAMSEAERAAIGLSEGFFRLSVGTEPIDLLKARLDAGLAALG